MKSRVFITGAGGFAARHLGQYLLGRGQEVWGLEHPGCRSAAWAGITWRYADICDGAAVQQVLDECRPLHIYHLAAQSSVGLSWEKPAETIHTNVEGAVQILEAVRRLQLDSKVLLVGSGEEYGPADPEDMPLRENRTPAPQNPYSLSKLFQEMLGLSYYRSYGLKVYLARSFNHTGPGQRLGFVVPDFAVQVARIEAGLQEPVLQVGNLSARRDFTDVRDVVRAYECILDRGQPGTIYNVGSEQAVSIGEILELLLAMSTCPIEVRTDPRKFRPVEVPILYAGIDKLRGETGWQPQIPLGETLAQTLEFWRHEVGKEMDDRS